MKIPCRHSIAILLLAIAGCASISKPTTPIDGVPPLSQHTEWRTTLPPASAAKVISQGVVKFGFHGAKSFFGGNTGPAVKGDFFDSTISTANDHKQPLNARAQWLAEGKTILVVESDLPSDRHAFVVRSLKQAIADAEASGK